jgi:hypothetical protein
MFGLLRVFLRLPKGIKYLENKARSPNTGTESRHVNTSTSTTPPPKWRRVPNLNTTWGSTATTTERETPPPPPWHHEGWAMNGTTIRRRGGYGRNRAQTTRHVRVVWAQVCFFHILSILLLMFLHFYRFIYYFDSLQYDGGEGMAGTGFC